MASNHCHASHCCLRSGNSASESRRLPAGSINLSRTAAVGAMRSKGARAAVPAGPAADRSRPWVTVSSTCFPCPVFLKCVAPACQTGNRQAAQRACTQVAAMFNTLAGASQWCSLVPQPGCGLACSNGKLDAPASPTATTRPGCALLKHRSGDQRHTWETVCSTVQARSKQSTGKAEHGLYKAEQGQTEAEQKDYLPVAGKWCLTKGAMQARAPAAARGAAGHP